MDFLRQPAAACEDPQLDSRAAVRETPGNVKAGGGPKAGFMRFSLFDVEFTEHLKDGCNGGVRELVWGWLGVKSVPQAANGAGGEINEKLVKRELAFPVAQFYAVRKFRFCKGFEDVREHGAGITDIILPRRATGDVGVVERRVVGVSGAGTSAAAGQMWRRGLHRDVHLHFEWIQGCRFDELRQLGGEIPDSFRRFAGMVARDGATVLAMGFVPVVVGLYGEVSGARSFDRGVCRDVLEPAIAAKNGANGVAVPRFVEIVGVDGVVLGIIGAPGAVHRDGHVGVSTDYVAWGSGGCRRGLGRRKGIGTRFCREGHDGLRATGRSCGADVERLEMARRDFPPPRSEEGQVSPAADATERFSRRFF